MDKAKKKVKLKQIAAWISLFIGLTLLLYFEFPLKVIFLFIALFCLDCLCPKRYQKCVNIFYCITFLAIVIWVLLPDQQEGWRPYICYDEIVKLEQQRHIPDEQNAALVYEKLFESINLDEFRDSMQDVNDILLDKFWIGSDYPDTVNLLDKYSTITDQVCEAVKLDQCYFPLLRNDFRKPVNYKEVADFWYRPLDEMSLRYIGEFLLLSANNDVSNGKISLALKKYFAVFQIANHLSQQSEIMDIMIRMSLEMKTFRCLQKLLLTGDVDTESIGKIEEQLMTINHSWKDEITKVFEREKLRSKSFLYAMFYQINTSGDIRYNRDPNSVLPSQIFIDPDLYEVSPGWLDRRPRVKGYLKIKAVKASLLFTNFFVPSDTNETERIFNKNLAFYVEMLNPDYDWKKKSPLFTWKTTKINLSCFSKLMLEGIFAGYYEKVYDVFLKTQTAKQGTQIMIQLKRFKNEAGYWPVSLDVISDRLPGNMLTDPMNGGAFVYRVEGDNFVFYSRGQNDNDEYDQLVRWYTDGPNENHHSQPRPDDLAIWPHVDNY